MKETGSDWSKKRQGVLDAADRILGRIIDGPRFKNAARYLVNSLDPEASRGLVRTAMWRDPDLLFTAVGAVPKVINSLIFAADELLAQIESKLTPRMRRELAAAVLDEIDWNALDETLEGGRKLFEEIRTIVDLRRDHGNGEGS